MKVGISGASGRLGKAVLAEIAARSADVKLVGISRTPNSLASGVESRLGDYDRSETLTSETFLILCPPARGNQ